MLGVAAGVSSVTGQTVVYILIISVVTWPSLEGQSVTLGAQDVIVYTEVAYTVEVVYLVTDPVGL